MKIEKEVFESTLTTQTIDDFSEKIRLFLVKLNLSKQQITRYTLSSEEIMLDLMKENQDEKIKLTIGKKLLSPFFSLEIEGKEKNVFIKKDEEHSFFGDTILSNLNLSPDYSYSNNQNVYNFTLKRKHLNPLLTMTIAFVSAIIIGLLGYLFSESFRDTLTTSLITPLYDTFLNILGCLAGPMIFLSVAWGIYGMGDVATLKRIGKTIFLGYIRTLFICLLFSSLVIIPFFSWNYVSSGESGSAFSAIFQMILDIFPKNIIEPFYEGNTLQIIFIAIIIGIALIFLGKKTTSVARAIEQINYIIQFITETITKLVPIFTFIVLLKLIWTSNISDILSIWKLFAVLLCVLIVVSALLIGYSALKQKVNYFNLFKKGLPTLVSAITTASSAAAFGINVKSSNEEFGIDKSLVAFSIPLGMVLFKVTTSISFMILAYYFAEYFNVEVSITWFILVILISGILAMATPPIPGGATIAYTILYTQFHIPLDALAITIAIDVFLDFITTGFDQFLLPFGLINQTAKINMLDKNVLRSKKQK